MEKKFREWNTGTMLLPPSVDDFVPDSHLSVFVRNLCTDSLDLTEIYDSYKNEKGSPPFDPTMMTALILYAYSSGVYSSRKIAKACIERVDFMAVTGMQHPEHRTICEFRRRHLEALKGLFLQILKLCAKAGLAKLGHVALDGTKIQANASKHKAMSYGRMCDAEKKLKTEIDTWFREARNTDDAEDNKFGKKNSGDEMPDWVANKEKRLAKIKEAKAALEKEAAEAAEGDQPATKPKDKAQKNFTDPESRIMKTRNGFEQAYNAQAAVDADSQVIVATTLTNQVNDKNQLDPMVQKIKENNGRHADEISADAGYCSEENLKKLDKRRVKGYIATGRQKHGSAAATGDKQITGQRTAAMAAKLRQGGFRSRYRLRKQTVEPVFGQIKEARGFRRFSLRGLDKVAAEWDLVCTAHNICKLAKAMT